MPEVDKETKRRHQKTLAISTLVSMLVTLGPIGVPMWEYFLRPVLVKSVSTAMAQEIDEKIAATVEEKVQPLSNRVQASNAGLKAIITNNIMQLEEQVSSLEYVRDFQSDSWTDEARRELLSKESALRLQREALTAILEAERPPP
jgi:hypothetical protein